MGRIVHSTLTPPIQYGRFQYERMDESLEFSVNADILKSVETEAGAAA
jgi:hypothetical protein